ncbi:MAG TPA: cytochrome c biogenesis protein ResB [Chloroflexota bacterium]|nr:cytochrome c biogenesis protein ResB [Chloroflexota bacterium]
MAEAAAPLIPEVPTIARARASSDDLLDRLWRLLTSVRFAMLLIGLIAGGVFAGTVIMQAPASVAASPDNFAAWLAQPRGKYGEPWAALFGALDLYRVFSSLWFRALLAVLTLSVVVCTVNRMPGIVASVTRPTVRVPERLFERAPLRAELSVATADAGQAHAVASRVLRANRFRVVPWQDGDAPAVFADRNRFGKYGTFINHIGIVSILGAAVMGGAFGWRDDGFMVPEGSTRAVGHGTTLSLKSESFDDEYWPQGMAKDFRSEVVLYDDGAEVARKTIRVNDPLDYKGIRFHQAFFGPAAVMRVRDGEGKVVHEDGVALGYELKGGAGADGTPGSPISRNGGYFTLGRRNGLPTLAVWVVMPANIREADPEIPAGSVRLEIFEPRQARPSAIETLPQGETREILGHTFEFVRERQFSGVQISYNPAVNLIWLSCGLMVLGSMAVFYFPLRRVWVRVDPTPAGARLRVAAVTNKDVLFAREFERLTLAIDRELDQHRVNKDGAA